MKTKNLILAGAALFLSVGLMAQHKGGTEKAKGLTVEEKASKQTDKMTEMLQLNEKQKSDVAEINLSFTKQTDEIKDRYQKQMREELKAAKLEKDTKLKEALTSDQYKQMKDFEAEKRDDFMEKPTGPQGPKGDRGEQGLQGPKGEPGRDGETPDVGPIESKLLKQFEEFRAAISAQVTRLNMGGGSSSGGGEVRFEFLEDVDRDSVKRDGYYLRYDADSGKFVGDIGTSGSTDASTISFDVKNGSGVTLLKGTPVYANTALGASGKTVVGVADAAIAGRMPAIGVLSQDLNNNEEGKILVVGVLENLDTSSFNVGDVLYVAPGGTGLTNIRPTDVNHLIQNVAKVTRSQQNTGQIIVEGSGRTNQVPNEINITGNITANNIKTLVAGENISLTSN